MSWRFVRLFAAAIPCLLSAQSTELTLAEAVTGAIKRYPQIQVSQERANAAAAAIQLARTAYLPRVDATAQINRATRNNVFGLLLPQSTIPSISGPVIGTNNAGSVWGSAAGFLVSWEPFDFGLRSANIDVASRTREQAQSTVKRSEFEVAVSTADAYLTAIAAGETVRAAQAGVERARAILETIHAQVAADLRPGADQSRAEAELAAARTQTIQAEQALEIAKANVGQFAGEVEARRKLNAGRLLDLPPEQQLGGFDGSRAPAVVEQSAAVDTARAQLRASERSYFPRFSLGAAAYARGTGAEISGQRLGGANGLAPNVQNYAVGLTVTFPIMELPAIRAREAEQSARIRAEEARRAQVLLELRTQWARANVALTGARAVAANIPIQINAARAATEQASARYRAGLGGIDEVAESQRLLTQAEIDGSLARLNVWRALLGIAAAAGDLQPFLAEVNP